MDPLLINTAPRMVGHLISAVAGHPLRPKPVPSVCSSDLDPCLGHALHTGSLRYQDGIERIPAAAISTVDASALSKAA